MTLTPGPTGADRGSIQWGTTTITYALRWSPARRKTVAIAVEPRGAVVVTAPRGTPESRISEVVRSRARWILGRVKATSDLPPALPAREFVNGETFVYLGRQYRLRLLRGGPAGPLALRAGRLELALPGGLEREDRAGYAKAALLDWYRRRATEKLPRIAAAWAPRVGVEPTKIVIREQQKRWASCDRHGVLRLNWRIIQAPMSLIEYVVAHELVHLRHPDHTREFWAALGRVMPDYDGRRRRLREVGVRLWVRW